MGKYAKNEGFDGKVYNQKMKVLMGTSSMNETFDGKIIDKCRFQWENHL